MPKILQFRRDTTSALATTLGAEGEIFVDLDQQTLVVMDGTTTGGTVLAKAADLSAVSSNLASVSSTVSSLTVTVSSLSSRVNYSSWTIRQSSNSLYFIANGINVGRLDTSGNLTVIGNITAFGVVP
jgi:hypothetical protein